MQSGPTHDIKNHRGPARSSCRSKRSLTILSQTVKSVTEEAITGYHHCPKSWRRYSGLTVLTQQYCLSSMGSQTPKSSSSSTKPPSKHQEEAPHVRRRCSSSH